MLVSEVVVDVSRDVEDFRRFLMLRLFRLVFYRTFEGNKLVYCVGLLVRCEDPDGWVGVWHRCYEGLEMAKKFFDVVEVIAKNRLGDFLLVEVNLPRSGIEGVVVG